MNLKLLRSILGTNKRKSITISKGTGGKVSISFYALESLALRKILLMKEIRKATVTLVPMPSGAGMCVELTVSQNDDVPSLTQSVQDVVRDEILKITGIQLQKVQVDIDKVISKRPRVR